MVNKMCCTYPLLFHGTGQVGPGKEKTTVFLWIYQYNLSIMEDIGHGFFGCHENTRNFFFSFRPVYTNQFKAVL